MDVPQDHRLNRRFFRAGAGGGADPTLASLSPARKEFVRQTQQLQFGTIHDLKVRGRDPVLDPQPRMLQHHKNGRHGKGRVGAPTVDFVLKEEWVNFFRQLDTIGDGIIPLIEVADGLPVCHKTDFVIRK